MTVSILDDSYHRVHARLRHLPNEYEVMDYVVRALKGLFGIKTRPRLKSAESAAALELNVIDTETQKQNLVHVTEYIQMYKREKLQGREKLKVNFRKRGSTFTGNEKLFESSISKLSDAVDRITSH